MVNSIFDIQRRRPLTHLGAGMWNGSWANRSPAEQLPHGGFDVRQEWLVLVRRQPIRSDNGVHFALTFRKDVRMGGKCHTAEERTSASLRQIQMDERLDKHENLRADVLSI
jgi:hypothetical protein